LTENWTAKRLHFPISDLVPSSREELSILYSARLLWPKHVPIRFVHESRWNPDADGPKA